MGEGGKTEAVWLSIACQNLFSVVQTKPQIAAVQLASPARASERPSEIPVGTSPLRYPGGKTRAIKILMEYISDDIRSICSPFLGGGSLELALAGQGRRVYGYDSYEPLVNFWQHALKDARALARYVRKHHHPMAKEKFYELQKRAPAIPNDMKRAAAYFALNRCSFSGCTLSGGMSPGHPRFTASAIGRLENFQAANLSVQVADFKKSIPRHKKDFLYLDPPYYLPQRLYGEGDDHIAFDHEGLANLLRKRDDWILSYNDCKYTRWLYRGYRVVKPKWIYGMCNGDKKSREVLVLSPSIPHQSRHAIKVGNIYGR